MSGIKTVHIAYKGAAPALTALLGGEVSFNYTSIVTAMPHVKAGRIVGVAVTTEKRSPALPDIPAIGESIPGYEVTAWYGIVLPAGTPPALIQRINTDLVAVLHDKAIEQRVVADGGEIAAGSAESFRKLILADIEKWVGLAKSAHLKLD